MNRPGLEEMLFDAEAQAFDTLLVFRVDRLSRKVRELALMVDELTKYGVVLKSITEPFDTANAAGKMMLQMLGVFAEFEHATIVERTKVGMEKKAKGGKFVGGNVPYGFRSTRRRAWSSTRKKRSSSARCSRCTPSERKARPRSASSSTRPATGTATAGSGAGASSSTCSRTRSMSARSAGARSSTRGTTTPLVSEVLFEKAQEVLAERARGV